MKKIKMFFQEHYELLLSISLMVYAQLTLKWRINSLSIEELAINSFKDIMILVINDYFFISALFAFGISALFWTIALNKFEMTYVFLFSSLVLCFIFIFSIIFLNESLNVYKIMGVCIIILGFFFVIKDKSIK